MLKIEDVEQFHRAFGHPVKDCKEYLKHFIVKGDTNSIHNDALDLRQLRVELVREEAQELVEAAYDEDPTLFADALFDLLYVTYGAILALGVPREIGDIVHKSNMSKGVVCDHCGGMCINGKDSPHWNYDTHPCERCNNTGVVPILREDGKILKGPDWVDDKPLIAECIEKHCREWDKEAEHE